MVTSPTMSTINLTSIVTTQFNATTQHTSYSLLKSLRDASPSSQHVPTLEHNASAFPLLAYLSAYDISVSVNKQHTYGVFKYNASSEAVDKNVIIGAFDFTYSGTHFTAYHAAWAAANGAQLCLHDLVFDAPTDALGKELAAAVYKWANELKDELWVFESGMWVKSKPLYEAIRAADWDDIVLDETFREGLRRDTSTFFASKKVYKSLGITWKRGILLLGPPGNGKTESIKALLHDFDCAALYVKSIATPQVCTPQLTSPAAR